MIQCNYRNFKPYNSEIDFFFFFSIHEKKTGSSSEFWSRSILKVNPIQITFFLSGTTAEILQVSGQRSNRMVMLY